MLNLFPAALAEGAEGAMQGVVEQVGDMFETAGSKAGNKGVDCALGAIEMVNLIRELEA